MMWDGKTLGDIVKAELYNFFAYAISEVGGRSNSEYAALLKKRYNHSGRSGKTEGVYIDAKSEGIRLSFVTPPEELGDDHYIWLTWGMAARHIRAWEYEKAHDSSKTENIPQNTLSAVQEKWERTHLCGSKYNKTLCEFFLQTADSQNTIVNGKKLDRSCYYCTSENKIRKIGSGGSWTGLSPKFCPKRKALEQNNKNPEQQSMCDDCANNDVGCLNPTDGKCAVHLENLLFLAKHAGYKDSVTDFLDKFLQKYPNFDANRFEELKPFLQTEEKSMLENKATEPTYFDVFLQHYPIFDTSRFDEFADDVCVAECFDDVNGCLGNTAGKHDTACKISCGECWKNVCKLQWKMFDRTGTEKYIEPYLTAEKKTCK